MKKIIYLMAALFTLTACNNDSDYTYEPGTALIANGLFIVQEGNFNNQADGSIGYYDYFADKTYTDMYFSANSTHLTGTINDAVVCGDYIYILGSDEKTVYVAAKNTMKKVTNIQLASGGQTFTPRRAVTDDKYVYVSTYERKVLAIDVKTNSIAATYDCGSYSEGMTIANGFLYVANSDYGNGNASISKINLSTGTTETIRNASMYNVTDVQTGVNNRIFYIDAGTYQSTAPYTQENYGIYELKADGTSEFLTEATEMKVVSQMILGISNPYTYPATTPKYFIYNIETKVKNKFCEGTEIESPSKISVDLLNSNVLITSRHKVSGYPSYNTPGYCTVYRIQNAGTDIYTGQYLGKFECGIGPSYVIPNTNYVQY